MAARIGFGWAVVWLLAASSVWAQQPWRGSQPDRTQAPPPHQAAPAPGPGETVPRPQQPPRAPFRLTPQEQAQVDMVLRAWEKRGEAVKTFECDFARLEYDPVFGPKDAPAHTDQGMLRYSAPDKGLFEVVGEVVDGHLAKGQRAEKWVTDGKSIFAYNYQQRKVVEHPLPPEMQGKNIVNGPIPFLFGSKADDLKRRYWIRLITPEKTRGQTWLEVYPKFQEDAGNYRRVDVILNNETMLPLAIQVHAPNGKNRTVYNFGQPLVNDPLRIFKGDPFRGGTPFGWKRIVEPLPATQASNPPAASQRR